MYNLVSTDSKSLFKVEALETLCGPVKIEHSKKVFATRTTLADTFSIDLSVIQENSLKQAIF